MQISPRVITRIFIVWMAIIYTTFVVILSNTSDKYKEFYRIGPHEDLIILGIQIDTLPKYWFLITYSFINSIFRTLSHSCIRPWILNNIQNDQKDKTPVDHKLAYEMITISTIYEWTDWLLYMNILLSQIDMLLVEIIAELAISYITTYYYLKTSKCSRDIDEIIRLIDNTETE